jgi:hypothetical protein
MNRRLVTVTLVALALAGLVTSPSSLAAAQSSSYVITGAKAIGGYKVGTTYAQALRYLGYAYSTTQSSAACTARWTNGVTIIWHRKPPATNWTKACARFSYATVKQGKSARATWRTDKGLRVGASLSQVKKLYPAATSKSSNGYSVWNLAKASKITLQAWVRQGRVSFFRLTSS